MTLKERVEDNVAIWLLGSLLTGFLSGIAAYKAVGEMAGRESISREELHNLQHRAAALETSEQKTNECETRAVQLQQSLDKRKCLSVPSIDSEPISPQTHSAPKIRAAGSPSPVPLFPELSGIRVLIYFTPDAASKAYEVQTQLKKYGATVTTKTQSYYPNKNDLYTTVYYGKVDDFPAATACTRLFRVYGFSETSLLTLGESDLMLHIRAQ